MLERDRNAAVLPEGVRVRASMPLTPQRSRAAIAASVIVHTVLIAMMVWVTTEVAAPRGGAISDALTRAAGGGGGGGGSGGSAFAIAPPRVVATLPADVPPNEKPPTVVPPATLVPDPLPALAPRDSASGAVAAGAGVGSGGGQGTGTGSGSGSGTGPGSGGGSGGGVAAGREGTPPEARQFIVPPLEFPKSLRGQTVAITFDVAADGRVTDIAVSPPISDRRFGKKFDEVMRSYRFKPARNAAGQPIAASIIVEVTFQGNQ